MQPTQPNPGQQEYINSITPPKKKAKNAQSTQGHLNFAEIHDGVVIMRDGSLRMIILCSPTNYDLKSSGEKEAIEFAYQGFLNGLHFPIQISIQSRIIDLEGYLGRLNNLLSEQSNPLLAGLMEDYIFNIRGLLATVNIMDKKFFVIVPYFTAEAAKGNVFKELALSISTSKDKTQSSAQYEQHKRGLMERVSSVAQGLGNIGVRTAVLRTQEVIELFYGSYNVGEATHQSLVAVQDMITPLVTRKGGQPQPYTPPPPEAEPPDLFSIANMQPGVGQISNAVESGKEAKK